MKTSNDSQCSRLRSASTIGLLFFLVKGLLWLALPVLASALR